MTTGLSSCTNFSPSGLRRAVIAATIVASIACGTSAADADSPRSGVTHTNAAFDVSPMTSDLPDGEAGSAVPPPARLAYLQYGVAFTAEFATSGVFCSDPQLDCILGSGGGIAGRVGWRGPGDWYLGGAYELSKQDPTKLYRLAILQQLRFEARHYWLHGNDTQPVVVLGGGFAGYGNEWSVSTFGPVGFIGGGVEYQVQNGPVLGITFGYRPLYLVQFADTTGHSHGPGIAHMFGLELSLEAREPL